MSSIQDWLLQAEGLAQGALDRLSPEKRAQWMLRAWSAVKVPMLFSCNPEVREYSSERLVLRIGLNRWTKNHLGSMYLGALTIGAECAAGLPSSLAILDSKKKIDFVFKESRAQFIQRPEGAVDFINESVPEMLDLIQRAQSDPERLEAEILIVAKAQKKGARKESAALEKVAEFRFILSVRNREFETVKKPKKKPKLDI